MNIVKPNLPECLREKGERRELVARADQAELVHQTGQLRAEGVHHQLVEMEEDGETTLQLKSWLDWAQTSVNPGLMLHWWKESWKMSSLTSGFCLTPASSHLDQTQTDQPNSELPHPEHPQHDQSLLLQPAHKVEPEQLDVHDVQLVVEEMRYDVDANLEDQSRRMKQTGEAEECHSQMEDWGDALTRRPSSVLSD